MSGFDTRAALERLLAGATSGDPWASELVQQCGGAVALRAHLRPSPKRCPECGRGDRIRKQRRGRRGLDQRDRRPAIPNAWACGNCGAHFRTAPPAGRAS